LFLCSSLRAISNDIHGMYAHAKRTHALHSLDFLVKVLIVYSYLIDPYLIRLLARYIVQTQILKPKDIDASISLRGFMVILAIVHTGPILRHLLPNVPPTEMVLLDFIGRMDVASPYLIAALDVFIFVLQTVILTVALETAHWHPDLVDPLAPDALRTEESSISTNAGELEPLAGPPSRSIDPLTAPIFHIRLRTWVNRLMRPPPLAPATDLPQSNTTSATRPRSTFGSRMASRMLSSLAQGRTALGPGLSAPPPTTTNATTTGATTRIPGGLQGDW